MKVREETIPLTVEETYGAPAETWCALDNTGECNSHIFHYVDPNYYSVTLVDTLSQDSQEAILAEATTDGDQHVIKIPMTIYTLDPGDWATGINNTGFIEVEVTKEEAEFFVRLCKAVHEAVERKIEPAKAAYVEWYKERWPRQYESAMEKLAEHNSQVGHVPHDSQLKSFHANQDD